jgi:hypothetical protein
MPRAHLAERRRPYAHSRARYDRGVRRLPRILWTTFAAASLLCCAAAAGVWVRSYFVADAFYRKVGLDFARLTLGSGRIAVLREVSPFTRWRYADRGPWWHDTLRPADLGRSPATLGADRWDVALPGFSHAARTTSFDLDSAEAAARHPVSISKQLTVVHLVYPTATFALAPLAWLAGYRKRRRRAARARGGLCASCGYDLRASAGRCPECGAVPAA